MIKVYPNKYKIYKFDDIAFNISERVEPNDTDLDIYVGLEHLDPECIHIRRRGVPSDVKGTKLRVYPGDIIFGKRRAYQRKAGLVGFDGICSAHAMVVRANPKVILPELLPFFMHSDLFMHRAVDISEGSLSPTIKWKILAEEEFKLPPLDEQKLLADLLWSVDKAEEKYLYMNNKISIFKRSYLHNLFDGKLNNTKIIKLIELCNIRRGASPRPIKNPKWFSDNGPGWIRIADVTKSYKYLNKTSQYLSDKGKERSVFLEKGSLIMSICATIGKPVILNIDACIHDGFVTFEHDKNILSTEYLFFLLTYLEEYFIRKKQVGTQGNLNTKIVGEVEIPLLDMREQENVVMRLNRIDGIMHKCAEISSNTRNIKKQVINEIIE